MMIRDEDGYGEGSSLEIEGASLWTLPYGVTLLSGCQELRAEG